MVASCGSCYKGSTPGREEGAFCGPLHGCADSVVVNYYQRFGFGHCPWRLRANVTKGVPVTLLTLLGHPPDVGLYAPTALAPISLHSMVFSGFSHRVRTSFLSDLRSRNLINGEDNRISCIVYDTEVQSLYDREWETRLVG